ncbi:hypothetical protein EMCRGX_G010254 [Ephydatia muelleri]
MVRSFRISLHKDHIGLLRLKSRKFWGHQKTWPPNIPALPAYTLRREIYEGLGTSSWWSASPSSKLQTRASKGRLLKDNDIVRVLNMLIQRKVKLLNGVSYMYTKLPILLLHFYGV